MVVFKNFFGTSQSTEIMTSALDLVTSVAGLASNSDDIRQLLGRIRSIAERVPPSGMLPPEDEAVLFKIYLEIERYLMTDDPIRTFTKEELRAKASRGLRARLESYEK
jgi:hypothetical protein